MLALSTIITYPVLLFLSRGKKSFENLGTLIQRSGDTARRLLQPAKHSFLASRSISQSMFANDKTLYVAIDDTLVKKIHSKFMRGAGMFFDTKIGRRIMAYRLAICIVTDGKFAIPIDCNYFFPKEILDLIDEKYPTKTDIAKAFVKVALKLFPDKKIIVVVDGLYSSVEFISWCRHENIKLEARMHSNRVVEFNGERIEINKLLLKNGIRPKGRQMARTIAVSWHNVGLELTIVRRFDKNDNESIVFQVATYKALPREHVETYSKRWKIEELNRTTKQKLGLQECFSRSLEVQHNHTAAVLLAYSIAQLERKLLKLQCVEHAIRGLEMKTVNSLTKKFICFLDRFQHFNA